MYLILLNQIIKDYQNIFYDPNFDPEKHMEHLETMELNDKMYIEHMIPHHQVVADMSKVLLKILKMIYDKTCI